MQRKITPSEEFEKEFFQRGAEGHPVSGLIRLGARLMLQGALEEEVAEVLGCGRYERSEQRRGHRNGYERTRLMCGEGALELKVPQARNTAEPFRSRMLEASRRRTDQLEELIPRLYVKGLSTRDVESVLQEGLGLEKVSRSVVSRLSKKLWKDFETWRKRDLSQEKILYLFLDAIYLPVRPGSKEKEGVLCAYGINEEGKKVLLHLALGNRESYESWKAFLHDLVERGIKEPLLVVMDGNPGLKRAVRECWPNALRQRCQVHKMRNLLAKLPRLVRQQMKPLFQRVFCAESYSQGIKLGRELIAKFRNVYPEAMECLEKELEQCLTNVRLPREHRKRIRTTNLLERLFGEGKRHIKIIPRFPGETSCLTLLYSTLIDASRNWRGVRMTPAIYKDLEALREGLKPRPQAAVA